MPTIIQEGKQVHVDGFVSSIILPDGKILGLKASIIAVKPISCPKCGGQVTLRYGEGKCDFCSTHFTTKFELIEDSAVHEVEE